MVPSVHALAGLGSSLAIVAPDFVVLEAEGPAVAPGATMSISDLRRRRVRRRPPIMILGAGVWGLETLMRKYLLMRIVSLNAWGGAVFDGLAEWISEVRADVLCLQEVTRTPGAAGWTTFEDGERQLPQRADLFADVARLTPLHQAMFVASDTGPVLDGAGERRCQDFGLGTFVSNDLPVVGSAAAPIHGSYSLHATWPTSSRPRVAQGIRVFDASTGRAVSVVHFHGLRDRVGKYDTAERDAQTVRIVELIEAVRSAGDLTVVCGDMNVLPDSRLLQALTELGLEDLVGEADTRTSLYAKPVRHASYMLISDPSAIESFEIQAEPEISDHRPLVLNI